MGRHLLQAWGRQTGFQGMLWLEEHTEPHLLLLLIPRDWELHKTSSGSTSHPTVGCTTGPTWPSSFPERPQAAGAVPTLSPSSPGGPTGPAGPGSPTGPWMPSRPAGPWGPFSPWKQKNRQVTHRALQPTHYSPLRFYSAANDSWLYEQEQQSRFQLIFHLCSLSETRQNFCLEG